MRYFNGADSFSVILAAIISIGIVQDRLSAASCPCDIFATGGTPCVAAHSTVRALYSAYNGPLYQVSRLSEAEAAALSGTAAVATDHTGYTGTGFVAGFISSTTAQVLFTITAPSAGQYSVQLRYSAGNGASSNTGLFVNGTQITTLSCPATASWDTWATVTQTVTLNAGSNTIAFKAVTSSTACINLDNITIQIDIYPLTPGGIANAATQDAFLGTGAGTISEIYDQSGKANHLKRSQGGGQVCMHVDQEAVANALPFWLGGHRVYGIKVISDNNGGCTPPAGGEGTGYRLDKITGIATGDQAETEYMITSGTYQSYQNSGCCFDYGNVETNDIDDGAATMEAIYFGGGAGWGHGGGSGPWVMADMENGIFSGSTNAYTGNTSVPYPYVTAVLIGRSGGTYALLAGNAQSGALTTMYDGARPSGYTVMKKQGAITLGTGGDNSDHGMGYFYEGVMTSGAATVATMNLVQANIVAAKYGDSTLPVSVRHEVENAAAGSPFAVRYIPSNGSAVISYTLQGARRVSVNIFDQRGKRIAEIVNGGIPAGRHEAVWNTKQIPTGVYIWRLAIDGRDGGAGKIVVGK